MLEGFVDLHCHFLPAVDDGARNIEESRAMLAGLARIGFVHVVATPHIRPGLFDNTASHLRDVYSRADTALAEFGDLPRRSLSAEHYFDDVVYSRILSNDALPYSTGKAILLEFYDSEFPYSLDQRLADICRRGMTPVIAHPERYSPIAKRPEILERLLDLGAVALLDLGALVGKYGRHANRAAEELLDRGYYRAACSDAHGPKDLTALQLGIDWVRKKYGDDEVTELLSVGPRALLEGRGAA